MSRYSKISCKHQNHRSMPYEYVCLNSNCVSHNRHLCCLYCCEQYHKNHKKCITTIKEILVELQAQKRKTEFNLLDILLRGMQTCSTFHELQTNFSQLLAYRNDPNRFEKILDQEMENLQNNTQRHYQRVHQRETARTLTEQESMIGKPLIKPVLTFKENSNYTLNSSFSVTNPQNQLITVFAYPSLSKFHESISTTIKIERYTPSWLAVGLSLGESKYQQKSSKHVLAISNGWISNFGSLEKSKVRFGGGDQVVLKWDKNIELLEISSKGSKETIRFENRWNQEVYLCVCLFYSKDKISILS